MEFTGFRDDAFAFFRELAANNSEEWFEANQARFEEFVVAPMRSLVLELREDLRRLHPCLVQEDVDAHFSEMRRGPQSRPGTAPIKTSFYCFFWDGSVRRLNDGWFFVGVGADGVTIGMSIYDFGDPESRMRRIFKPRLRRYLTYLDDYIKANYLRRGFDFHRYVRAAGKLGIREVEAFPDTAADWDSTLGWVVKRHLHTESSRLTPGSFLTEVRESFERLYPLYSFTSDPREEFLRLLRVPARARAMQTMQANGPTRVVPTPAVAAAPERGADARVTADAPVEPHPEAIAVPEAAPAAKGRAKRPVTKKDAGGKPVRANSASPKKSPTKKTAAKKTTTKKTAAKQKAPAKKATAPRAAAKRKTAKKAAPKKKLVAKKKTTAKKIAPKKKAAARPIAKKTAKGAAKKPKSAGRKSSAAAARASARSR